MSSEIAEFLQYPGDTLVIDCTLGMGGHAESILRSGTHSRILGLEMDEQSLGKARNRLQPFAGRVEFRQSNFLDLFKLDGIAWPSVTGILLDPGLSMDQIKDPARGFSHSLDGPLDMRKDASQKLTAAELINRGSEAQLAEIFFKYGQVNAARSLAKRIIEKRLFTPFRTTLQLSELVESFFHWRPRRGVLHPAAKVFQALRIAVNNELDGLKEWIGQVMERCFPGTRLAFLAYHSLEDRIVKEEFRRFQTAGRFLIKKPFPVLPDDDELERNPASRSARLRLGEIR